MLDHLDFMICTFQSLQLWNIDCNEILFTERTISLSSWFIEFSTMANWSTGLINELVN